VTLPPGHEEPRARVFISCGQSKNSDELATAHAIGKELIKLGFEYWIALEEQTLDGIKEHIFEKLLDSEYLVFVDFKRERFLRKTDHRGSLFSHQELMLASYLGLEVLAFQESGVRLEGLLAFIGGNAIGFKDRKTLPRKVRNEILKRREARHWDSSWRKEIVLERERDQFEDVKSTVPGQLRRFFHIGVRNRHPHKAVTDCYVYLERATNLETSTDIKFRTYELKWEGYCLPYVNIPPLGFRRFDAFRINHESATQVHLSNIFSDWNKNIPQLQGVGRYVLSFVVLSSNFPPARKSFMLSLAPVLNSTTLD
jgi:hypothetical protein